MSNKLTIAKGTGASGANLAGGTTSYVELTFLANTFEVNNSKDVVAVNVCCQTYWSSNTPGSQYRTILIAYSLDGGTTKIPFISSDEKGTSSFPAPTHPQANLFFRLSPGIYTIKFYTKCTSASTANKINQTEYTSSSVVVWSAL